MISESLIKNILFFKVNKLLGELFDHCQISIMLRTGHQIYNTSDSTYRSHPSPSTYKWDENSTQLFLNAMSSTRIDELIINFNENNYNKGNAKRGTSPRLKIRPCDLDR
jgi:hypothetical protein